MRRLLLTGLVLAILVGTSSPAAGAVASGDATGTARACEAQAQNRGGGSSADGLECAGGASLTGTLRFYSQAGYTNACWIDASGSGLQPGSEVWIVTPAFGKAYIGQASSTGEWFYSYFTSYSCSALSPAYLTGTAASGNPIRSATLHK